jgi:predicted transcriptional regulator
MEKLAKIQGIEEDIPTFFALSPQGYEKMSGNLQEMRRYILEQKEIIVYYKDVTTPDMPYEGTENGSNDESN